MCMFSRVSCELEVEALRCDARATCTVKPPDGDAACVAMPLARACDAGPPMLLPPSDAATRRRMLNGACEVDHL